MFFRYGLYYINISKSPIYLTRDGYVDMTTGSLRDAGVSGDYWASPAYPSELYAYDLDFYSANVIPSNNDVRWAGFTVQDRICCRLDAWDCRESSGNFGFQTI